MIALILTVCMAATYHVDIYDKPGGKWLVQICNEQEQCVQQLMETKGCKTFDCVDTEASKILEKQNNLVKKAIKQLN